ncbi:hypothetical protein HK100_002751, partial [Physocladia obscura]
MIRLQEVALLEFFADLFPKGFDLNPCTFGECAAPSDDPYLIEMAATGLNTIEIAAVAAASFIIAIALSGLIWSLVHHQRAKNQPESPPKQGLGIKFESIGYTLTRNKKSIINGVSGFVNPGNILAIMGPSGAGKSTFLDILAGKTKSGTVTGSIQFDNVVVSPEIMRNVIGFVDQEDVLMPTLTVRETLMFSAQLRLPESVPTREKKKRVEEVMAALGLTHVADVRVGGHGKRGISGGEKRRVSIGVELVTSPAVIVLDEPTSGLDSYNALSVIRTLSDLAHDAQKTVIFTIHQPR